MIRDMMPIEQCCNILMQYVVVFNQRWQFAVY